MLAFFFKLCTAGAAGHLNFSFSSGNPQGLVAVGTFEIPVVLITPNGFLKADPLGCRLKQSNKSRIFHLPLELVGREEAEQRVTQNHKGRNLKG